MYKKLLLVLLLILSLSLARPTIIGGEFGWGEFIMFMAGASIFIAVVEYLFNKTR